MRKQLLIALVLAAFVGIALAQRAGPAGPLPQQGPLPPQQQQLPPGTASLSGSVVVMGTNQPLAGAAVELRRIDCNNFSNPPEVVTAKTGADGKFVFQNLRPGGWCIVATMPGGAYTPAEYMQRGALGRGATIPISDGQKVIDIQLAMAPTGGIAGRIRDFDGEFLGHARVQVMEVFNHEGQRRLYILQVAQTNDRGEYRFYWLPPGQYYLAVVPENTRGRQVVSVQPPPGAGGRREDVITPVVRPRIAPNGDVTEETYVTVYYPSETDVQRALPIDVQPGVMTSGIDIALSAGKVRSYHVRGTVTNAVTGEPAAGAQIRLAPREWTATVVMPSTTVDPKGNFDLAGVVPGNYFLFGTMSMPNPAPAPAPTPATAPAPGAPPPPPAPPIPLSGNLRIDMGNSTVEKVQFSLGQGAAVTGKIVMDGAAAATALPRGINISLARDPDIVGLPSAQVRGMVQPDGTFTLQNVGPGDYRLYVMPFITPFQWGVPNVPPALQNTYVKAVRVGNIDALGASIRVGSGVSPGEIEVVLSTGGRIDGVASNDRREPLPNVTVALIPDGQLRARKDLFKSTTTDISGRFKLQGIPPGTYKAFAWEQVDLDIWQNPDFIRPLESRGTTVEVRDGSQATAEVQAIPAPRR